MFFATISDSGLITLPTEILRALKLNNGDTVEFYLNDKNEVVICKSKLSAIHTAQKAFEGTAEELGLSTEDDVQSLIDEFRGSNN